MSVVIAIRDDKHNRFILGSDKQVSAGNRKDSSGTKVWEVEDYDHCCMGGVGSLRANQIMQYVSGLVDKNSINFEKDGISSAYVALALTETIWATLEAHGMRNISKSEDGPECKFLPNEFMFAFKDSCWVIHSDMSITEVEDYAAIGSGDELALGSLEETAGQDPYVRIVKAVDKAADHTLYVNHEVDFVATDYIKTDMEKQMLALGYDKEIIEQAKVACGISKPKKKSKDEAANKEATVKDELVVEEVVEPEEKSTVKKTAKKSAKKSKRVQEDESTE